MTLTAGLGGTTSSTMWSCSSWSVFTSNIPGVIMSSLLVCLSLSWFSSINVDSRATWTSPASAASSTI
uniref:Uncharacterized protein n=1 Tax=Anguilla anguilla TaxID=7936 RepID=A0A0E9RJK4_ANGAN